MTYRSMGVPRYLEIAENDIGVAEFKGARHHPRILEYHSNTGKWTRDEVPYCGSAIETWLIESGFEGLGRKGALARSWMKWGIPVDVPMRGDIVVLRRRRRGPDARTGSRGGYHVALYDRGSKGRIRLLGANQSDAVKYSTYSLRRYEIMAIRRAA